MAGDAGKKLQTFGRKSVGVSTDSFQAYPSVDRFEFNVPAAWSLHGFVACAPEFLDLLSSRQLTKKPGRRIGGVAETLTMRVAVGVAGFAVIPA
jgi:hypothetical protein